jgi:hypothetical protein
MTQQMDGSAGLPLFDEQAPAVDQGEGQIRPRARLLRTIGAELISSEVVAVIELVRNCYDADATRVDLVFNSPEDPDEATLEIRDNGHGMTREVALGPWLEPATEHKRGEGLGETGGERSPRGRRRLGSKGVGRFAVQRLGDHLELRTRAEGGLTEMVAWFDWAALESGKYLDELRIPWRERQAIQIDPHGTHLHISGMRDRWSRDRFDKLRLGLSRLISPTMDEDFRILITINGAREEIASAVDPEAAMYSIRGRVDDGGRSTIHYRDINGDEETWERHVIWPEGSDQKCGPFEFRISAWDLDSAPLRHFLEKTDSEMGLRDFRKTIREHSGISLYRDGFRILPYGEPDNDWLRLDRRRVNNPTMRFSNNQILGAIHLTADGNPHLSDQTNREGLVTNEAYSHLQSVVLELLSYFETRRFAARRAMDVDWQRRTSSLPSLENEQEDPTEALIRSIAGKNGGSAEDIDRLRGAFEDLKQSAADTVRHYAGLASAGQMSGLVFRQLEHPIQQIRSELDLVVHELDTDLDPEAVTDMRNGLKAALQYLKTMEKQIEKLDPLAIGGRGRRVTDLELGEILSDVLGTFKDECDQYGVSLDFSPGEGIRLKTNREIVQHALAGLMDNAIWWARHGESTTPIVSVRVVSKGFTVSDNGPGIPERIGTTVFEPHFTMREGAHGLGLTLVKDLVQTVGGTVRLRKCKPATFYVKLER